MASNTRRQLENWLKTIEVHNTALDVGGISWPIIKRTKIWDVYNYKLLDVKKELKGIKADYVYDLNKPIVGVSKFHNVFCVEVLSHIYNPMEAIRNLNRFTMMNGHVYLSVHFLFPNHMYADSMRFTRYGISKLLDINGFKIEEVVPKYAVNSQALIDFCSRESKVVRFPSEIGYFIKAIKTDELR